MMIVKILGEPLSLAVLNGKNADGMSAIDLAEYLLRLLSKKNWLADFGEYFEVVAGQGGEEGWKMIRWLK